MRKDLSTERRFVIAWAALIGVSTILAIFIGSIYLMYEILGKWGTSIYIFLIFITGLAWAIAVEDDY